MLVKALYDTEGYYKIIKNRIYIAYACEFLVSPEGNSKMLYYVDVSLKPNTLIISPQDAKSFGMVDSHVPDDWRAIEFDRVKIQNDYISSQEQAGYGQEAQRNKDIVNSWQGRPYRSTVISFPEMLNYDFWVAAHDDNLEDEEEAVFEKYYQKYKKLHTKGSL